MYCDQTTFRCTTTNKKVLGKPQIHNKKTIFTEGSILAVK
jgi:hypothetical protein